MKINNIHLTNIKKFGTKGANFNFYGEGGIFTISGGNGSGKTAIFKALQVFQKIVFFQQLTDGSEVERIKKILWNDIDGLLSDEYGVIDVQFKESTSDEFKFSVKLILTKTHSDWGYEFANPKNGLIHLISEYWDINDPKDIVAFIDAGKSFSEFGVGFDSIKLLSRRDQHRKLILDCVFEPEKTLQSIYRKTVIDHIQYRLDPKRTYTYFKNANEATLKISGNIDVANVSSTKYDGQLVIVGKTSNQSILYDVKDFSAGERSLYLTLLFLFYLPKVGILIIDEPENHLHESLLCKFYDFLLEFINEGFKGEKSNIRQIFLTTHSRALIYRNLDNGICFGMGNDEIIPIASGDVERDLRAMGISAIHSKTIFVEGSTEVSILSEFFNRERINVVPVNNCNEVVQYFRKISTIRSNLYGAAFCFVIDSDNMAPEKKSEIKGIDPKFFDESFCILECHEIENLLIDEKLILDVINNVLTVMKEPHLSSCDVDSIMSACKKDLHEQSLAKFIASEIEYQIKNLFTNELTNTKKIQNDDFQDLVNKIITQDRTSILIEKHNDAKEKFLSFWEDDWKSYIDGKAFLGKLLKALSHKTGIRDDKLKSMLWKKVSDSDADYKFSVFYKTVLDKFGKQN